MNTCIGRVADMLRSAPAVVTPLERQLDALTRRLLGVAVLAVLVVFAIGVARGGRLSDEVP